MIDVFYALGSPGLGKNITSHERGCFTVDAKYSDKTEETFAVPSCHTSFASREEALEFFSSLVNQFFDTLEPAEHHGVRVNMVNPEAYVLPGKRSRKHRYTYKEK